MNKLLILSILCSLKSHLALAMAAFELDDNAENKCAETIIQELECRSLTLVNFNDDTKLAKNLHKAMKYKIILRYYLNTEMDIPNEAYTVLCKNREDCDEGLQNLVKDRYWNPTTTFCFIIKIMTGQDIERLFKKLHSFNVFKAVILNSGDLYLYNFEIGNHCVFTPQAISKYECKWLYRSQNSKLNIIRHLFKDFKKRPYADCSIRIRLNVVIPYIFPTSANNVISDGFEEEFVNSIIKNFANSTLEYDESNVVGFVSKNYTTTYALRDIQNDVIDGILGATILSHNRVCAFDFTTSHIFDDIVVTVPKAVNVKKWIVMFTLFKPKLWALIFLTFFLIQLVEFVPKICGYMNSHGSIPSKLNQIRDLLSNYNEKSPRFLIILWVLLSWYVAVFYQSGLASVFTKPVFYHQINTVEEILKKDYELVLNEKLNIFAKSTKDMDLSSFVEGSRKQSCNNNIECMNMVATGGKKYAFMSRLVYKFFEPLFHDEHGDSKLYMIQNPYYHLQMTTYLKKGNPNTERLRFLERNIVETGLKERSMTKVIHENKLKYFKLQSVNTNSLCTKDIAGLYYLLFSGCVLSMITFLCELVVYRRT